MLNLNAGTPARTPVSGTRPRLTARLKAVARSLSGGIALFALLILLNQYSRFRTGQGIDPFAFTRNSALLFSLVGLSLWLREAFSTTRWRRTSTVVALAALGLGAAAVFPGVDRSASPQCALALACLACSVLLLDWEPRDGIRPAQSLALVASALSVTTLLGYLYAAPALYTIASYPPISTQEAMALFLLSVAALFARPEAGMLRIVTSETAGGFLARSMPLAVVALPTAVGWLALKGQWRHYYDAQIGMSLFVLANMLFFSLLIFRIARSLDGADSRRTQAEDMLRVRARQRAVVAQLGQRALSGAELPALVESGVRLVGDGLPFAWGEFIDCCGEIRADGAAGRVCDHLFTSGPTLVVDDLRSDERFDDPELVARGVVSAALITIQGTPRPYGALAAYSPRPQAFSDEDLHWLQTLAAVLTSAHERRRHEDALRLSEEKFSGLFRSSPDAIIVAERTGGHISEVNEGFLDMTGLERDEVIGRTVSDLGLWPEQGADLSADDQLPTRNAEVQFRTRRGDERIGLASTQAVTLGDQPYVLTVVRDVSDRKRAQEAMQDANDRLTEWVNELEARSREISLLNEMGDLLQTCLTSKEASAIAAQFARQLLPGSCGAICTFADGGRRLQAVATWGQLPADETAFGPHECWGLRRGRPYSVQSADMGLSCEHVRTSHADYLCVPMMAQGEALGILHARGNEDASTTGGQAWLTEARQRLIVAITEHVGLALANVSLRERLRSQSVRDQLTGLYNRRYLEESLEMELVRARRSARSIALLLIDLDKFKAVNDTYGHDVGDELLRAVSQVFKEQLRAGDIVCRYGGEEFLFVLPEISLTAAVGRAEQIRLAVRSVIVRHRNQSIGTITASVGLALFPDHGSNTTTLLRGADAALYRAKGRGGDCIEWSDAVQADEVSAGRGLAS